MIFEEVNQVRQRRSVVGYYAQRYYRKLTGWKLRRAWIERRRIKRALMVLAAGRKNADAPRHGLPGQLVISLTSYPGRFSTLHLTLQSLLDQTVRPDRVALWIADGDIDRLPAAVRALEGDILQVRTCEDLRNFKKILPSLLAYPDAFILICDDDSYYPDDWLRGIVEAYDPREPTIVCTRAHRVTYLADGRSAPYKRWAHNVSDPQADRPSTDIVPTGNGGVLYPPGSLDPQVTDLDLIRKLSATSDDIWLYFMWRQAGWKAKRVPGGKRRYSEWPNTQGASLTAFHRGGKKDEHFLDMARHFGLR